MKKQVLVISCALLSIDAAAEPSASSLPKSIADNYLRSFPSEKIEEYDITKKKRDDDFDIKAMRPPKLGPQIARSIIFNTILAKSVKMGDMQQKMQIVLNPYAWSDLKIFYGSRSAPDYTLIKKINKTVTMAGEAVLAALLVTPTSNIEELNERQGIVKMFVEHIEDVRKLRTMLADYRDAENSMLSFYSPTDPLYAKEYRKYMEDYYYAKSGDESNKSAGWLEFKKRFFRDTWGIVWNFTYPQIMHGIDSMFSNHEDDLLPFDGKLITQREMRWKGSIPIYGLIFRWKLIDNNYISDAQKNVLKSLFIVSEIMYVYSAYKGVCNYLEYSHTLRNLAIRMSDIQVFVKTLEKIEKHIAANPELEKVYGSRLVAARELLARAGDNTELGNLLKYLIDLPYKKWSYFFNNAGKLLASHTLFVEYKDDFADAMFELGQLDAYAGVAVLVHESQMYDKNHAFTFTRFLDRSERSKPYLKLKEMWNPFLDAKVAVGNDVEMGDSVRNIILTGPNAGGKSTFLTGVTTSILLSQSFGIAPAQECVITPFNKINTYIDIADDIASGDSLFIAEVKRAQQHIKIIKLLKQYEYSFTILDEPFSGTNPTEGPAAEYSILEAMAEYENSLTIVSSHYHIVTLLEDRAKHLCFANRQVCVTEEDHRLNYPYKVIPGKSTQTYAIRTMEEQGFDVKLLHRAKDIIKNPENYRVKFGDMEEKSSREKNTKARITKKRK